MELSAHFFTESGHMKNQLRGYAFILLLSLTACGLSPPIGNSAQQSKSDINPTAEVVANNSGLSGITHAESLNRRDCRRHVRTGSRIARNACKANSFNGLFPGGVNLDTAGESQPGYGRKN